MSGEDLDFVRSSTTKKTTLRKMEVDSAPKDDNYSRRERDDRDDRDRRDRRDRDRSRSRDRDRDRDRERDRDHNRRDGMLNYTSLFMG